MKKMLFEVAFMPKEVKPNSPSVCVVIDVIRASTTMTRLVEKGASKIVLTNDEHQTLRENPSFLREETMICAEQVSGEAADIADFSPSLKEIETAEVKNQLVVMRTTNGTVAIHTLRELGIKHIFIGCMNNARAVMNKAVRLAAELNTGVIIVAAGRDNTNIAALDDTYCAAKLLSHGQQIAAKNGIKAIQADSGIIASKLMLGYTDTFDAFSQSASGAVMRKINCEEDIFTCAQENTTEVVAKVIFENSLITVKNYDRVRD